MLSLVPVVCVALVPSETLWLVPFETLVERLVEWFSPVEYPADEP
jgi:hypothetical protein